MKTFAQTLSAITGDDATQEALDGSEYVLVLRPGRASTWSPGSGGSDLIDIGVIDFADLYAGAAVVADTSPGLAVAATAMQNVVTPSDNALTIYSTLPTIEEGYWAGTSLTPTATPGAASFYWQVLGEHLYAVVGTRQNAFAIESPGVWEANHEYAGWAMIEAAGFFWAAYNNPDPAGGLSGPTEPDFAGNPNQNDHVTDNEVIWTNEGLPPTGVVHVYMLMAA